MIKKIFLLLALCCSSLSLFSSIYVTGQNSEGFPCLWITDNQGNKIKTTVLDENSGNGRALIISNNQIYVVGLADDKACLWITDLLGTQHSKILLSSNISGTKNFVSDRQNLYIVGSDNLKATLWIVNLKNLSVQSFLKEDYQTFSNLVISDKKLYIIGSTTGMLDRSTTLWINDLQGNTLETIYLSNLGSHPSGISQKNKEIYCYGSFQELDPISSRYYLTKLDLEGNVVDNVEFSNQTTLNRSNYIISTDTKNYLLTTNSLYTTLLSQINSTPYTQALSSPISAVWYNFFLQNNLFVIVGLDDLGATLYLYNMQGNLIKQTALDQIGSAAFGVAAPQGSSSLFKFSPIKYQKGSN